MVKIHWESAPNVSVDTRNANAVEIKKLGLPNHRGAGRLAVVGSGPSINEHIEELKNWPGQIWAINGTINWCVDHGIDAWFYTCDACGPDIWPYDLSRITKAVLTADGNPAMVKHLQGLGAVVELVGLPQSGPTSANASDYLAIECGYTGVTYFGCEGSFAAAEIGAASHGFKTGYSIDDWMIIELGGEYFKTKHEYIASAIMLHLSISEFPHIYSEKSGGLLRAMLKHGIAYEDVMVANSLYDKLRDAAA